MNVLIRVRLSIHPTEESHVGLRRIIPAVAAVTGVLACASPALAAPNTYCVAKPSCNGIDEPNLQAALDAAKMHGGSDRVELGSGDFTSATPYTYQASPHNQVNIVGTGADSTRILTTKAGSATTLTLHRGSVTDVEVVGPPSPNIADVAVALDLTGRGERLKLTGGWTNVVLQKDARLLSSTLTGAGLDFDRPAVLVAVDDATLADSVVEANAVGVRARDSGVAHIDRSTITARTGVAATSGGGVAIRDSLVRGIGTSAYGLLASANDDSSGVYATNVTIVSTGDGGSTGAAALSNKSGAQANVELRNSVVTRAAVPLRRNATLGHAFLTATNSAYDADAVISEGDGAYESSGTVTAEPGFVDAPGNDFHLAPGSPLIDAASPAPAGGLSALDRDGQPRSIDGNGDGTAAPDIGAFEVQTVPAGDPGTPPVEPPVDEPPLVDVAPVLSKLSLTHRRFRKRTTLRFRLSEDAKVKVAIRHRGKRAVVRRHARAGHKGKNRIRLRRRGLAPGRYAATVTAVDPAGHKSAPRRIGFRILR